MKRIATLLLLLFLAIVTVTGCSGDNPPIPPNGSDGDDGGEDGVQQVVLVESFMVNECTKCGMIKPYLEQLAAEYGKDKMILVEVIPWGIYSLSESKDRYNDFYKLSGGVPRTMFNGGANPLIDAYGYDVLKNRIAAQLKSKPKVKIEAVRTKEGETSVITGSIKNIGTTTLSNLVINGMTVKSIGNFKYAVADIFEKEKIQVASLEPGESKSFTMTLADINWEGRNLNGGVIFVQETTGTKLVRQSVYIK